LEEFEENLAFRRDNLKMDSSISKESPNMNATSDSQVALLQAARNGQRDALDGLLGAFRNYLKLLARAQLGSNSQKRIEPSDLVQETLLDAYRGFDGFQGQTMPELISWLRQILVRKLVDQFKAQRAEKRDPRREISLQHALDQSSQELAASLYAPDSNPSSHLSREEQSIALANALERLSQEHREVIILRLFENLSFNDIAQQFDRSSGAVRMLFARAIDRLRQVMQETSR
jgi:RNA polymerase sigma-70 factor (ECF subfamily)